MFPTDKCSGRSGSDSAPETKNSAQSLKDMGKEDVPKVREESPAPAVSDEIGDILKDELADADKLERIGAELADLSAELGLLAGLADGGLNQPDFPSLFEIAMGHRGSASGSSSSSYSSEPRPRPRRPPRTVRAVRRKPISKGKDYRVQLARARRDSATSDDGDGSDDDWSEIRTTTSDSSSKGSADDEFAAKAQAEVPPMGQFLLPLLNAELSNAAEHSGVKYEDIWRLIVSAELSVRSAFADCDQDRVEEVTNEASGPMVKAEEPASLNTPVTAEEEAALKHFVCESEKDANECTEQFSPLDGWLLDVYHSWCEINALMKTTGNSFTSSNGSWYRAIFPCHCSLCVPLCRDARVLRVLAGRVLRTLANGENTVCDAVRLMRAMGNQPGLEPEQWDWHSPNFTDQAAPIIHEQLLLEAAKSEFAKKLISTVCICRPFPHPMEEKYAIKRFCRIIENFKAASSRTFKVELLPSQDGPPNSSVTYRTGDGVGERLKTIRKNTSANEVSAWSGHEYKCDCLNPRTLCEQQRNEVLRLSFSMLFINEFNGGKGDSQKDSAKVSNEVQQVPSRELLQGDGADNAADSDEAITVDLDSKDEDDEFCEDDGGEEFDDFETSQPAISLCRTVRHLMQSVSSVERMMDRVLKHCERHVPPQDVAATPGTPVLEKSVDEGLSLVNQKLMSMYRRLPEVHRKQLQVYRKQKKLSTVCGRLAGVSPPPPPPPGSPPPAPHPEAPLHYHLQRFKEVRRKVMHMRDQQLYYHRLRTWLEDQLRQDTGISDLNVRLVGDQSKPKRRVINPKAPRLATAHASKRKLKPTPSISKSHKILQLLKLKAPSRNAQLLEENSDGFVSEADPPEAFPLEKEELSETDTVVGENTTELSKEMKECLAKFANFALEDGHDVKYPESVSPPLQDVSPIAPEPLPVYIHNPSQRMMSLNKLLSRTNTEQFNSDSIDFDATYLPEVLSIAPLNAKRTPVLIEDSIDDEMKITEIHDDSDIHEMVVDTDTDPVLYKYVTFGMEIKKAMEECQNIINTCSGNKDEIFTIDGPLTWDKICDFFINIGKNAKLAELAETMPQIFGNMPGIASKLLEFANNSLEVMPEFASIMDSLPEITTETQLTPETLRQIRELKLTKTRDNVKVTKNTTKRKTRKYKTNDDDVMGTMTLEFNSKEISAMLQDEKNAQTLAKSKPNKEDLLYSVSAQVVIGKVFEYLNKSPDLAKYFEVKDRELLVPTLFDTSVKSETSLAQLKKLVNSSETWKHEIVSKYKSIPCVVVEYEIERMKEKFFNCIRGFETKQSDVDPDKVIDKVEEMKRKNNKDSNVDGCPSKESLKQIAKLFRSPDGVMRMSNDNNAVTTLRFKYFDVIKSCIESEELCSWVLLDPEIASNVITEMTGLRTHCKCNLNLDSPVSQQRKLNFFMAKIQDMNVAYTETIPKNELTGVEWLAVLFKLEELENDLKKAITKVFAPKPVKQNNVSETHEAEILAGKGLSKIIGQANKVAKKPEPKPKIEPESNVKKQNDILSTCEAILSNKGEKYLVESLQTVRSYITQGIPVPESYKKHVISICSSIDPKLVDSVIEESLNVKAHQMPKIEQDTICKISAQVIKKAKEKHNAALTRMNSENNGHTKSESDLCDTPTSDCNWTNDCICDTCKNTDATGPVCLGDIVKKCYDKEAKSKAVLEEKKKATAKPVAKPNKVPPKACENGGHQQHICKVGHGVNTCSADGGADQPCSCCYCTVFGHAPPITTPVPRNFNETRERLRSILNKKKQQCRNANGTAKNEVSTEPIESTTPPVESHPQAIKVKPVAVKPVPAKPAAAKPVPVKPAAAKPVAVKPAAAKPVAAKPVAAKPVAAKPVAATAKPPVAAKTVVPKPVLPKPVLAKPLAPKPVGNGANRAVPNPPKPQIAPRPVMPVSDAELQQRLLTDKMAQMNVNENTDQGKYKVFQRSPPVQVNVPSKIASEGKINSQVMEQVRQQVREQQKAALARQRSSSRESSALSTCSGCDMGSCWRGEDPRDLDALLQYIEGPTRLKDRGKKKAKKQRQKAKKLESKLLAQHSLLTTQLATLRERARVGKAGLAQVKSKLDEVQAKCHAQPKGKKHSKAQSQAENEAISARWSFFGELTTYHIMGTAELKETESLITQTLKGLRQCEEEIKTVRRVLTAEADDPTQNDDDMDQEEYYQNNVKGKNEGNMVRVRRVDDVTSTFITQQAMYNARLEEMAKEAEAKAQAEPKKQTWEQALAHMNQIVKSGKEKKKKEAQAKAKAKAEAKTKAVSKPEPIPQPEPEPQPLNKKQRRALAKKLAEEEEQRKQLELEQSKKKEQKKKSQKNEPPKQEPAKKESKKEKEKESKKEQTAAKSKEKEEKKKKGKESKVEKSVTQPVVKPEPKQKAPQPPAKKESKKKIINITPDTTIEMVGKKGKCSKEVDSKAASCSIMEQLSCGVQVADLRLPPGITLTRVQPNEKKEPPTIKSVPLHAASNLSSVPTPPARPPPVIAADPYNRHFATSVPDMPKPIIIAEPPPPPPQPTGKSKKAKKKAKKAAAAENQTFENKKQDGNKMVTLRNPMFHPNLPPVQVNTNQQKKAENIKIPDPIPMPPTACQATITPTSNGMYTIRNPLMSMMHQQSLIGAKPQSPQMNQIYQQPNFNYVNPNTYTPVPNQQQYVIDPRSSPKNIEVKTEFNNPSRLMNLASFTQKNDEGYSLFKTNEEQQPRFMNESYYSDQNYTNSNPKPTVSPNPIGTRPNNETNRPFDGNDTSLFANPIQRPEPIGTPLKRTEESEYMGLYTPFGQEGRNVFRSALFDKSQSNPMEDLNRLPNGDSMPYFQRLRVGSKLNSEVTIHHVTESKFYKGQDGVQSVDPSSGSDNTLYSFSGAWGERPSGCNSIHDPVKSSGSSSIQESMGESSTGSPLDEDSGFGAVGTRAHRHAIDPQAVWQDRPQSDIPTDRSMDPMQRYEQLYMQKHRLHHLNSN